MGLTWGHRALPASLLAMTPLLGCRDKIGPDTIAFVVEPSGATAGEQIAPSVEVSVFDAFGDPAAGAVSLSLDPNPCGWTLGGSLTASLSGGRARFEDLSLDKIGRGYTLRAAFGTLGARSRAFDIRSPIDDQPIVHDNLLCTKPNNQHDAESITWIPEDDAFWMADDEHVSIYQVDRHSGQTLSVIGRSDFVAALPDAGMCDDGDGDPNTTCSYVNEFEQVSYDPVARLLYVVNTVNTSDDWPAIFRLAKAACAGCFTVLDWQPLPPGPTYGALAVVDGSIVIGHKNGVFGYDFATNRVGTVDANGDSLPPLYAAATDVIGLSYDGNSMWLLTQQRQLHRVHWATKTLLALYDLSPFSIATPKGLQVVRDTLYVVEGDLPNPINVFTIR